MKTDGTLSEWSAKYFLLFTPNVVKRYVSYLQGVPPERRNENTMTVMNLDDIRNLPPLSSEDWNILNSARPLVSDDCPEMSPEQLKDFRPWYDRQKQSVTLDIDVTVLNFYKHLASENGIPYQELMKLYLSQYANENKKPIIA